jgi:hypothetical protein
MQAPLFSGRTTRRRSWQKNRACPVLTVTRRLRKTCGKWVHPLYTGKHTLDTWYHCIERVCRRNTRAPGANLRCARLRRVPPQRRSSPAGASTRSGRASARTLSCFRHQDAQTPPSPRVGEGGRGDEGANVHTRARRPRTRRKPQVRTPPAHTPAETLQPRRSFHALRESFSPHPLPFQHQDAQTPPSPRVGEGGREDEGANAHTRARRPRT